MKYNSQIHHRKSIRLKGYDYSQAGAYFITICCEDRICRFGKIVENEMILNEFGQIAYNEWIKLTKRFCNFELDVFQIMPNHIHGIIALTDVGETLEVAQNDEVGMSVGTAEDVEVGAGNVEVGVGASPARTVGDIVGAYKSLVANGCLRIYKSQNKIMGKLWQRNYYEHIIRNEQSYQNISNYIINNPTKWDEDKFYKTI